MFSQAMFSQAMFLQAMFLQAIFSRLNSHLLTSSSRFSSVALAEHHSKQTISVTHRIATRFKSRVFCAVKESRFNSWKIYSRQEKAVVAMDEIIAATRV